MILQKNYVYVWCGNFHTDLRFRPKCIPFLNINFLLYFNFLVHRTLSIKIFSFQKFILQCKYFRHNNTVECSLRIQLPLLILRESFRKRGICDLAPAFRTSQHQQYQTFGSNWHISATKHAIQMTSEERRLYSQAKQVETSWKGHWHYFECDLLFIRY